MNNSWFCRLETKRCAAGALLALLMIFVPSAFAQTNNPVPLIDAPVVPAVVAPGGTGFTLTVNGAGFVPGASVLWNGSPRATTFVSDARLTAAIPASDMAIVTTASVKVSNPAPRGGVSNAESLAFTTPTQALDFAIHPQTLSFYQVGQPAVGDFNGDGKPDIAFTEVPSIYGPFSVCISLGNGDGTFQPPSCTVPPPQAGGSSQNPGSAVIGDFNGDGKLDLAVPDVGDGFNAVSIFLGNGDGTLQTPILVPAGDSPYSVATGDFNKDGRMDLAVVYRDNRFGILLGNGDGTFQAPVIVTVPIPPGITLGFGAITTGDFNLDGNLDLVLANLSSLSNDIYFVAGNGDGTFGVPQMVAQLSEYPTNDLGSLPAADLNGDGKLDLVRITISQQTFLISVSVLLGNGDGTFQPPVEYGLIPASPGITFSAPILTDLNGDGKLDIVFSHSAVGVNASGANGLWVLFGNGDGTFQAPTIVPYPSTAGIPMEVAAADLNRDGTTDVVAMGQDVQGPDTFIVSYRQGFFPVAIANPFSVSFSPQPINTTSGSQIVTLTNTGTATLNLSGISISGANSQDFAQTNTCSGTLLMGATCQINVTFTPSAGGMRAAALTISDSASGSPQTVALTGAGQDFSLSATPPTTATVSAGQTANYTLAVTPEDGFSQTVALTCSGGPALSACVVSPSSVPLNGTASTPVTVKITTTARSKGALTNFRFGSPDTKNLPLAITGLFLAITFAIPLFWSPKNRFSRTHGVSTACLLAAVMFMSSCVGLISNSTVSSGTPTGNYTIIVSATATVANVTLKHDANLTLLVQ
jgi:hypothetical protein